MNAAIIIGGGPAGCQCALWLAMLGYKTIIIEKSDRLGGLQRKSPYINNWLVGTINQQGQDIASNIQKQIEMINIPVLYNSTIDVIKKSLEGYEVKIGTEEISASHVVIATGVRPREDMFKHSSNVLIGPGQEIFHTHFADKRIAILGGGDNAAENYSFILEKKPSVCHVYSRTVRARKNLWERIKPTDIFLGVYKANQASMSIQHGDKEHQYDYFIVLYGWEANIPKALLPFEKQLLNMHGFIQVDESRRTRLFNIFAAGEVTHLLHPCVSTAMADGVVVAKTIQYQAEGSSY